MTRHEFLQHLHDLLNPKTYLEIGVQHGWSLNLAHAAESAFGIDPQPLIQASGNQVIYTMTSDDFFDQGIVLPPVDLAFIDGMHLYEYALRDFANVERFSHPDTVIVFDDVLPRNQGEAAREQCPGDWTGDVWKVFYALRMARPDLNLTLVNTQPTGVLMAQQGTKGVMGGWDVWSVESIITSFAPSYMSTVPDDVINRAHAVDPLTALRKIKGEEVDL